MKLFLTICFSFLVGGIYAQENPNPLPKNLTEKEQLILDMGMYQPPISNNRNNSNPPNFPTRALGEWEELQSIIVTWDAYFTVLRDIVKYSKEEVEVINICQDTSEIKSYLTTNDIDFENLTFIQAPFNTVWVRDYGPNPVYQNDVDSLVLIDWIYNRPRPLDDVIPNVIAEYLNVPIYTTDVAPNDLVHTGGNFMADGLGTGFSSHLVLEENDITNPFGTSNHSEGEIDSLMNSFMGIEAYPKMQSLQYDGINHIDMHMKLLDEQTLLVGKFPDGVSDGPQIEENIQFVLDHFKTYWGTDFRVERIIQPPCGNGSYPPNCQGGFFSGEYRTYTNSLFVNKTILVPIYNTDLDDVALARWKELMPGYKIRGIDCRQIINAGGAIHCVTKEIGVKDPLWIAHREIDDITSDENEQDYRIEATIKHRSGIESAQVFWTVDTLSGFTLLDMTLENAEQDLWSAHIPQQAAGSEIFYHIHAFSNSGKSMVRPLTAPYGYFDFKTESLNTGLTELENVSVRLLNSFPNPSKEITFFEVETDQVEKIELSLTDMLGRNVAIIFDGKTDIGKNQFSLNVDQFPAGPYLIQLKTSEQTQLQRLVIK